MKAGSLPPDYDRLRDELTHLPRLVRADATLPGYNRATLASAKGAFGGDRCRKLTEVHERETL